MNSYELTQVLENQPLMSARAYNRELLGPETSFERAERLDREIRRLYGTDSTSVSAAMTWANARIARKVRRKPRYA